MGRASQTFLVSLVILLGASCAKKPSPAYEEAADQFSELYRQKWDAAFVDPAMAEIEAKLESVPKDSLNTADAEALLKRIREGRARLEAEAAERDQAMAAATAATPDTADGPELRPEPAGAPSEEKATEDAGTGPDIPKEGMPVADLAKKFGGCFREGKSVAVLGKGNQATWSLRELPSCRDSYPSFSSSMLVISEGKVYAIVDKNALDYRLPDGGKPPPSPKR